MIVPGSERFASKANFFTPQFLDELTRRGPTVRVDIGRARLLHGTRKPHLESVTASRVHDYEEVYGMDKTLASEEDVRAVVSVIRTRDAKLLKAYFENMRVAEVASHILFKYQLDGLLTWAMVEEVKKKSPPASSTKGSRKSKSKSRESTEGRSRTEKSRSQSRESTEGGSRTKKSKTKIRSNFKRSNINEDLLKMPLFSVSNSKLREQFLSTEINRHFPSVYKSGMERRQITDYLLVNSFLPARGKTDLYYSMVQEANARSETHPMLSVCSKSVSLHRTAEVSKGQFSITATHPAVAKYSHRSFRDVEQEVNEDVECFALALIDIEDDSIPCADVKVDVMTAKLYRRGGSTTANFSPILPNVQLSDLGDGSSNDTIASLMTKIGNDVEAGKMMKAGRFRAGSRSRKSSAVTT